MTQEDVLALEQDQLQDKETLYRIFGEEDVFERQLLIEALKTRARDFNKVQMVSHLLRAFEEQFKRDSASISTNRQTDFGYPWGQEYNCGTWIANADGVKTVAFFGGETVACYHPILPVRRLHNVETQTEKITIAYKRNSEWFEITVNKDVIASASKIVSLAQFGVAVTSETAKALVRFLADLENWNDIPVTKSTSKLGWKGIDFLPYDRNVVFDCGSKFVDIVGAIETKGSREIYFDTVSGIRKAGRYEPRLLMAAAMASLFLAPLNLLPFVLNLSGKTGNGKTVSLMMATSMIANPMEHKYIVEVESTQTGFEVRMDLLNHFPLMIDDFSKVEDKYKDRFTDLIYMLTSGRGKDRANIDLGLNPSKSWCNCTIGCMEKPLTNDSMRGGAINRVLDFVCDPGSIYEDAHGLVEILKDNYGHLGVEFVSLIQELGFQKVSEMRKTVECKIRELAHAQDSEKEDKQVLPLSAIVLADRLLTDYIFKDNIYLDVAKLVKQLADINAVSDYIRAYDNVMSWVNVHVKEFDGGADDDRRGGIVAGFFRDEYVCIYPIVFKRIADECGFSPKAFFRDAKEAGTLVTNGDRNDVVVKNHGKPVRCIKIKMDSPCCEAEQTAFQPISKEELDDLPFN